MTSDRSHPQRNVKRRHGMMMLCMALFLVAACERRRPPTPEPTPSNAAATSQATYADLRKTFRTKLLREGPSPEPASAVPFSKLKKPQGVDEVEFPSGNIRLKAWTQSPPKRAGQKMPAVVFLHGGWGFDEGDWEHSKSLRDAGFVVLSPVLRGENGCPGNFTMFYDEVDDVIAAGVFVASLPHVDPERVYLAGYSAGGTLAMLASMTTKRFRKVVALDGSPDRRTFVKGFQEQVPFDMRDPEELRMRSPIDFPASFLCPTRLYCSGAPGGYGDETRRLVNAAKQQGLDVEMIVVPGNHGTFREPATKLAIDYFRKQ